MDNEIQTQGENLVAGNENVKTENNPVLDYISKGLLGSIKLIGYIGTVLGVVTLIAGIKFGWPMNEVLVTLVVVVSGIILVIISEGLLRKKIWGWYLGMIFFGIALISVAVIPAIFKIFVFFISLVILVMLIIYKKLVMDKAVGK